MYRCTSGLLGGELKWVASGVSDLKLLKNLANLINFRNRQDDVTPVDNYFSLKCPKVLSLIGRTGSGLGMREVELSTTGRNCS